MSSLLAVLLVSSVGGLLYGGDDFYDSYPASLAGLVGQDAVTLVLGIPLLLTSMRLTRRGSKGTLLVWAEALFYFAYSYYFYVIGASTPSSWSDVSWGVPEAAARKRFDSI